MAATPLTTKPFFLEASGQYHAADIRMPWLGVVREGAEGPGHFMPVPKGGTQANPAAGGAGVWNMTIDILGGGGGIWIPRNTTLWSGGMYRQPISETRITIGPFASNSSGSSRNDIVYAQVDEAGLQGVINWVQGTPGAGDPAIPTNATPIARVFIPSGTTQLNTSNVADLRHRAYREKVSTPLLGPDVRATQSVWTTIVSTPQFTLAWPRTVLISASVIMAANSGSTAIGQAYLRVRDTVAGVNYNEGASGYVNAFAGSGATNDQRLMLQIPCLPVELDTGNHQFALQVGRDGNGVLDALADTVNNSHTVYRTYVTAIL
jgi:hypothetical protein